MQQPESPLEGPVKEFGEATRWWSTPSLWGDYYFASPAVIRTPGLCFVRQRLRLTGGNATRRGWANPIQPRVSIGPIMVADRTCFGLIPTTAFVMVASNTFAGTGVQENGARGQLLRSRQSLKLRCTNSVPGGVLMSPGNLFQS